MSYNITVHSFINRRFLYLNHSSIHYTPYAAWQLSAMQERLSRFKIKLMRLLLALDILVWGFWQLQSGTFQQRLWLV